MKNRAEEIMKNYREAVKKIDSKYTVKPLKELDTKELDESILYQNDLVMKLENQGNNYLEKEENQDEKIKNDLLIRNAKTKLDALLKEKQEKQENYEKEKAAREEKIQKLDEFKKRKLILPNKKEVTQIEKDKMDKQDLENKARRELTTESRNISSMLIDKRLELIKLDEDKKKLSEKLYTANLDISKAQYNENDKKMYIKEKEKISAEISKKDKEEKNIRKEMSELSKMQEKCQEYLEYFAEKDKEEAKRLTEVLYGKNEKPENNKNLENNENQGNNENPENNKNPENNENSGKDNNLNDLTNRIINQTENMLSKPEIIISREPRILRNNYNIGIGKIKKLIRQKPEKIMSKLEKTLPGLNQEEIEKISKDMDPILLEGIMELRNKNILTEREIKETIQKISDGKATMEDMNFKVVYDMGDLSKGAFWPWNRKDRDKIAQLAEENKEQGIAEFKDGKEYEPDPIKRMLKRVQTKKLGEGEKNKKQGVIKRFFKQFNKERPEDRLEEEKKPKTKNEFKEEVKKAAVKDGYHKITDDIINSKSEEELNAVLNDAKKALVNKEITATELASIASSIQTQKTRILKEKDNEKSEKNEEEKAMTEK